MYIVFVSIVFGICGSRLEALCVASLGLTEATHIAVADLCGLPLEWPTPGPGCAEGLSSADSCQEGPRPIGQAHVASARLVDVSFAGPFGLMLEPELINWKSEIVEFWSMDFIFTNGHF